MNTLATAADRWVLDGFQAQQAGDLLRAEAAYRQALQKQPAHPAALQLLGLLLGRRGDAVAAEDLMRRSLRALPAQPHVWNNLANLLEDQGRLAEALGAFDEALALAPTYPDAHYNRARVLHALGRVTDAAGALDRALAHSAQPSAGMLQLQAQIESDCGRPDLALTTLDRALQLAPQRPSLLHNRATVLQRVHRYTEALRDHEQARALGLHAADAHYNRGNTLQSLGRHDEAESAYREALALEPAHRLALYDLSRLRWRRGDADFDADLRLAAAAQPRSAVAPGLRGQMLLAAGRAADAAEAYREACIRDPQAAAFHDGLGQCLLRLGEAGAGLAAHSRALALAPHDAVLRSNHAASLLAARRPDLAATEAQTACELAPQSQYALALLGLAWRLLGDAREGWLNDYARLVAVVDLEPPPGWSSMAAFNEQLAVELRALHLDRAPPIDQTLRHGTQTLGDIFDQGHPLVDKLKARISEAISSHVAALPVEPGHPFLRRRGSGWRYTDSWSSRLQQQGFHTNHVHPHGWLSSAYYVTVPPCVEDVQRQEGWLKFGEPDIEVGLGDAARLRVQPRSGRLALFPSMFWHGTTPFAQVAERLTIAFDVMPS